MNDVIVKEKIVIENLIYEIRGVQVILDSDLARLYECVNGTKDINKAVKRNIERFPESFMFQLTDEEYDIFDRKRDKNGYLTEKWTLKEAYGKFLGIGLTNSVLMTTVEGYSLNVKGAVVSVYPKQPVKMYYNEREIS